MATKSPETELLTMGEAAQRLHAQAWMVRRLYERKILPPRKVGRFYVVAEADLPEVGRLLREHKFLKG